MQSQELRLLLRELALAYASERKLEVDVSRVSAIMFRNVSDNFCPASFQVIREKPDWFRRTQKAHTNVANAAEMQSSNSSDALLMSIFCHPDLVSWKGVRDLVGLGAGVVPEFGYKALVAKAGTSGDETAIDMVWGDLFVEAKLTEEGFTEKGVAEVEKYGGLSTCFHSEQLRTRRGNYENYQVIRNVLAAIQHGKRHLLLCDERRPDLVRSYWETVVCLREVKDRRRCGVVFWQEIARVSGRSLSKFLRVKYGIL